MNHEKDIDICKEVARGELTRKQFDDMNEDMEE